VPCTWAYGQNLNNIYVATCHFPPIKIESLSTCLSLWHSIFYNNYRIYKIVWFYKWAHLV
jgi:hypothetical protein